MGKKWVVQSGRGLGAKRGVLAVRDVGVKL